MLTLDPEFSAEDKAKIEKFNAKHGETCRTFEIFVRSARAYKDAEGKTDKVWAFPPRMKLFIVNEELVEYFSETVDSVIAEMQRRFVDDPLSYLIAKMKADKKEDDELPF